MTRISATKRKLAQLESRLIGDSSAIREVRDLISRVSSSDATVLIQGESGTGKEVVARLVHDLSSRADSAFIAINCGAIPSELLESELFGHEKGAFTGAISSRKGRFELAEGGTLFLDEIGDMPLDMQVKLLRVLQEKSFDRLGGTKTINCNVRIIAATHRNLEAKIAENSFRADLFYRLSIFPIDVPPLRERKSDVRKLIDVLVKSASKEGRGFIELSNEALNHLENYAWPGNVREVVNLIERLLVLYPSQLIEPNDLPEQFCSVDAVEVANLDLGPQLDLLNQDTADELLVNVEPLPTDGSLPLFLEKPIDLRAELAELEREFITAALNQTDWTIAHAAKWLKLQRTTLVEKMRKYDIKR